MEHVLRTIIPLCLLVLLLIAWVLAPGTSPPTLCPGETAIPFTTIVTNHMHSLPEGLASAQIKTATLPVSSNKEWQALLAKAPQVVIVASIDDLAPLEAWLAVEARAALHQVDFSRFVVVAFFPMVEGDAHFIQCLAAAEDDSLVVYAVTRISHATVTLPWETFPYHVILIDRQDILFPVTAETPVTQINTVIHADYPWYPTWFSGLRSDVLCRKNDKPWWARVFRNE